MQYRYLWYRPPSRRIALSASSTTQIVELELQNLITGHSYRCVEGYIFKRRLGHIRYPYNRSQGPRHQSPFRARKQDNKPDHSWSTMTIVVCKSSQCWNKRFLTTNTALRRSQGLHEDDYFPAHSKEGFGVSVHSLLKEEKAWME